MGFNREREKKGRRSFLSQDGEEEHTIRAMTDRQTATTVTNKSVKFTDILPSPSHQTTLDGKGDEDLIGSACWNAARSFEMDGLCASVLDDAESRAFIAASFLIPHPTPGTKSVGVARGGGTWRVVVFRESGMDEEDDEEDGRAETEQIETSCFGSDFRLQDLANLVSPLFPHASGLAMSTRSRTFFIPCLRNDRFRSASMGIEVRLGEGGDWRIAEASVVGRVLGTDSSVLVLPAPFRLLLLLLLLLLLRFIFRCEKVRQFTSWNLGRWPFHFIRFFSSVFGRE